MKKLDKRQAAPYVFLVAGAASAGVAAIGLRSNYDTMKTLRTALFTADKNGGDTETALRNLRTYVYGHMNTNLDSGANAIYPPIQLQYSYERAVAAQKARQDNSQIYSDAQQYCEKQDSADFSGHNRVPCIEQYVTDHGAKAETPVQASLYEYDFVSPRWSPDLAGWSLLVTAVLWLVAIVMIGRRVIRHLRHR